MPSDTPRGSEATCKHCGHAEVAHDGYAGFCDGWVDMESRSQCGCTDFVAAPSAGSVTRDDDGEVVKALGEMCAEAKAQSAHSRSLGDAADADDFANDALMLERAVQALRVREAAGRVPVVSDADVEWAYSNYDTEIAAASSHGAVYYDIPKMRRAILRNLLKGFASRLAGRQEDKP